MDWTQVLTILGSTLIMFSTTVSMFKWARAEAREDRASSEADRRSFQESLLKIQKDGQDSLNESRKETNVILNIIQEEMKDFHGRLCSIEAARK